MTADIKKNGQACAVKMTSRHRQENKIAEYRIDQMGQLVQVNDNYYIQVDLEDENKKLTPTTFKFSTDGQVSIIRYGEHSMRMRFNPNNPTSMRYHTPYGSILLDIESKRVQINYQNQPFSGRIYIEYNLYTGQDLLGNYELDLYFTV